LLGLWVLASGGIAAQAADLTIAIEPRWKGAAVAVPSARLTNDAGQQVRFTRLSLLVSEVELVRADGSRVRLDGQFGLVDLERGRRAITMRGVPEGEFVGLGFSVGVPVNVNHGDPGAWPAGHPLHPVVNGLHWSWQGGYVFAAIEGRWREADGAKPESAAAGGERGFSYHLATEARRMSVGFAANIRIRGDTTIALALDLARVLAPLRLAEEDGSESTHSAEGERLAVDLAARLERAWFWLEAGPDLRAGRVAEPLPASSEREAVPLRNGPLGERALPTAAPLPFTIPAGFPQPDLPADNPLTVEGVALGEKLFFDPRLSRNGAQSCASCHAPARAFSDTVALSRGTQGDVGTRNAMPLFNLAWSPSYAWDGCQPRIRDQALAAWTNPIEMDARPAEIVDALVCDDALAERFSAAFGTREITAERVTLALEQYLLTLVAADSKFDRARRGVAELTGEERRGFELFATEFDPARGKRGADCFHCHGGALFTDFGQKNNGLDLVSLDSGRAKVTGSAADAGRFKTPSLRNVALTAPYMHDGRFATLEEVIAHYDHGVQRATTLDPNLAKHPAVGLALSQEDQRALVAFMRTLTDERLK